MKQVRGANEHSRILSAVAATVDTEDADDATVQTSGLGAGGCNTERHAACFSLLNATFATNVANQQEVVPAFDDKRLDTMCR